jgi:conjugative relaxase-like TrwC/TraI family protein
MVHLLVVITCRQIRSGQKYLTNHLSANDYYSETESIVGYWHGKGSEKLGIQGLPVSPDVFEAIRMGSHPLTGEKLKPRQSKVVFHDVVISAPKGFSIMNLVGGDERLRDAFERAAVKTFQKLESYAEVRDRRGNSYHTEKTLRTSNATAAMFIHDSSRLLDPQLHAHFVFGNLSWSEERGKWLALQPALMMEESKKWIREYFHRKLASECIRAGYKIEWLDKEGTFCFEAIPPNMEKLFSSRANQREIFRERYQKLFGVEPSKKRVGQFISDKRWEAVRRFKQEYHNFFGKQPSAQAIKDNVFHWRSDKMAKSVREKVESFQRSKLDSSAIKILDEAVAQAREARCNQKQEVQMSEVESRSERIYPEEAQGTSLAKVEVKGIKQKRRKQTVAKNVLGRPKSSKLVREGKMSAVSRIRLGRGLYHALRGRPNAVIAKQLNQARRRKV